MGDLDGVAPCSSLAVEAIIRVGAAGAIWGLCAGPYDARKQGLTGVAKASFVANSVGSFGFRCGFVAGVFSITRCGVQKYRGRNDWVNGLIGGAVAGGAAAAGTRSLAQVVGMAGLVSVFCAAADYSRTS
ncbi:outer envelope pore protein 16-4, chloroplastic [Cajanus cajan]|uniref:outer envelope pore protein 16-4, chloroplastic n=1 Tax=Cajanus cajan TaxID=3821 RepID=UPI00098D7DC3|nr:outer envelope pore protein 16-4, chloroplastic [Cajanus cajan]